MDRVFSTVFDWGARSAFSISAVVCSAAGLAAHVLDKPRMWWLGPFTCAVMAIKLHYDLK